MNTFRPQAIPRPRDFGQHDFGQHRAKKKWPVQLVAAILAWSAIFYVIEHEWDSSLSLSLDAIASGDFDVLDERVESGSLSRKLAFPVLGLTGLLFFVAQAKAARPKLSLNFWLFTGYALWTLGSVFWTADPELTTRRLVVFACILAAAFGFRQQFRDSNALVLVIAVSLLHLGIGIVAELAHGRLAALGPDYRFAGTIHPNSQGIQLSAAGLAALCIVVQSWGKRSPTSWLWLGLYAAIVLFVVMTRSRTALASFALASMCIIGPQIPQRFRGVVLLAPAAVVLTIAASAAVLDLRFARSLESLIYLGRVEETGTLTGRTHIWEELSRYFWDRPVLGYGYGGFWTPETLIDLGHALEFQPAHAHSAYLQVLLDVGFVGFGLMAITAVVAVVKSGRASLLQPENLHARFFFGFFVMGLVYSCLDTTFVIPGFINVLTFAGLMSTFSVAKESQAGRWDRDRSDHSVADLRLENQYREARQ